MGSLGSFGSCGNFRDGIAKLGIGREREGMAASFGTLIPPIFGTDGKPGNVGTFMDGRAKAGIGSFRDGIAGSPGDLALVPAGIFRLKRLGRLGNFGNLRDGIAKAGIGRAGIGSKN